MPPNPPWPPPPPPTVRLFLALIAVAVLCTWDGSVKTDCNRCACGTCTNPTIHAPKNEYGRCSSCGTPL